MNKMKPFATRLKPLKQPFDWTPLIDISFLLLIFMLVTTTSTYPKALHLNPIEAAVSESALLSSYAITIDHNHVIFAGPQQIPVAMSDLKEMLLAEREKRQTKDPSLGLRVTLSIDRTVETETLLSILSLFYEQGIPVQLLLNPTDY